MRGKYIYIPSETLYFKEYKILRSFMDEMKHIETMKPITYIEYQMLRCEYSFDDIIDFIGQIENGCLRWDVYKSIYITIKILKNERKNKRMYPVKIKRIHDWSCKRKALYSKK